MSTIVLWKLNLSENKHFDLEQIDLRPAPTSLNSASIQIPGGVYTTFRTYDGSKILPLQYQLKRLEDSAGLLGIPLQLNEWAIHESLKQALRFSPGSDLRLRLTVDLENEPGVIYLAFEPLWTPSKEEFEKGVAAVTCYFQREIPRSKRTAFIQVAETFKSKLPPGVNEGLLVDETGHILEGLSSNFFAVKNGVIFTAAEGVLFGITRALLLKAAGRIEIPISLHSIPISEVLNLDEAFLTGSSRSVLPIRQIDELQVGDGHPGPITKALTDAYWQELRANLVIV